jgi:hypothetical protein
MSLVGLQYPKLGKENHHKNYIINLPENNKIARNKSDQKIPLFK